MKTGKRDEKGRFIEGEHYPCKIETRIKIAQALKGKRVSNTTRLKMRISHLGKTHSKETKQKMSMAHKGKPCPWVSEKLSRHKNPNWKGGKYKHSAGYILILMPNHPFARKNGYIFEHKLVAEKALGRYLRPLERVHHLNGKRDDNHPKNLLICSHSFHIWLHKNNRILKKEET